jgi:hypothetical protein
MNLPSLSEKLINKKIVAGYSDSKESIDRELDIKTVDEDFKNILIYFRIKKFQVLQRKLL